MLRRPKRLLESLGMRRREVTKEGANTRDPSSSSHRRNRSRSDGGGRACSAAQAAATSGAAEAAGGRSISADADLTSYNEQTLPSGQDTAVEHTRLFMRASSWNAGAHATLTAISSTSVPPPILAPIILGVRAPPPPVSNMFEEEEESDDGEILMVAAAGSDVDLRPNIARPPRSVRRCSFSSQRSSARRVGSDDILAVMDELWRIDLGDLEVGPLLGQGSFAKVHEGVHVGTHVAIKRLTFRRISVSSVEEGERTFLEECQVRTE